MTAQELLDAIRADGVRVSANGGRLELDTPRGVLTKERLELDTPRGVLTKERLDQVRALKPELLALLADPGPPAASVAQVEDASFLEMVEDASFLEMVEDARRFQAEGKLGPWSAFTMSAEDLEGAIGGLPPELREDFGLRIGIYRRDGLPDDHRRRIALFLLASEHVFPLGEP